MLCDKFKIHYRIGTRLGYEALHPLTLTLNNIAENLARKLFALLVAYHGYLYLLFASEVLMIVHLASKESIGTSLHSLVQQE